ncbi:hypothetical protein ASPSYDRAFT_61041 [Aspergillus sydowii CBS 593.65]|uniref:Carboxyvinyl-carboxyphosphonate phosphorylmutase n=1 Tax=Aspergillus sydowii CBS 593.65 TaxID=1036612 RepID=A0A1L9T4T1_9EURO|nr:uncharacterized protein ASPSYDRAFT_61041 [Aspergillus sydowii CBS 593.65]OJJ54417.1 hypothetical protein ASPSYDRAFT_61041 [Aspergillus sydowii CBS 593.65]
MTSSYSDNVPYPPETVTLTFPNSRGRLPSAQASRLRSMMLEAWADKAKILGTPCSYDALSSRLVEEAGFPFLFLSGYTVASTHGLPDTGYIIMQQVSIPIMVDGDTGYGSPLNVKRTVESFALAGAAGVMVEDQTWPKRCGHTKEKSVVSREEAFARIQAACDARDNSLDILILARTDSLVLVWDEAVCHAQEFQRIGADAVFVEALPDRAAMERAIKEIRVPMMANIIEGGLTENLSAVELAELGFAVVVYPFTLVAAKLKSIREMLRALKGSMSVGAPPMILSAEDVCKGVGFTQYWDLERKYAGAVEGKEEANGDTGVIGSTEIEDGCHSEANGKVH